MTQNITWYIAIKYWINISYILGLPEPGPFDSSKPFCLKVDEKGQYYASPMAGAIPPLPTYDEALKMSVDLRLFIGNKRPSQAA